MPGTSVIRFAWLSIAAAIATISLKVAAYVLTGSVGLLSDALESLVNLVAAPDIHTLHRGWRRLGRWHGRAGRHGVSVVVPGLAYAGLSNQWTYASATLRGVGPDAAHVVRYLRRHQRATVPAHQERASVMRHLFGGWRCCAGKVRCVMTVASEQLWETFSAPLHQFILRRVRDPHNAEDILQDVFLKIHTRIDSLHQQDRVTSWIYQIARNAIADYYRSQRPTTDVPETLAAPDELVSDVVVQELLPCVAAMVNDLPDTYREALHLTEYQGLSQKQLGERLGISFSGAKSRVQRARTKIKEQLLACCHFQFDSRGRIIDYQSHCACCANGCDSACGNEIQFLRDHRALL
jgi:RNA polymerase sigma-70 factor, ECF subfamily